MTNNSKCPKQNFDIALPTSTNQLDSWSCVVYLLLSQARCFVRWQRQRVRFGLLGYEFWTFCCVYACPFVIYFYFSRFFFLNFFCSSLLIGTKNSSILLWKCLRLIIWILYLGFLFNLK